MASFHLNMKTGEPGPCKARRGNCPLAAAGDHFDNMQDAQKAYEERMAEETIVSVTKTTPAGIPGASEFSNLPDHSDLKTVVPAVMARGKGVGKPRENWYGVHSGRMNPTNGDGDNYGHWADGDSVILGERDGKRARVISGGGLMGRSPEENLGLPVTLTKQQSTGKDTETSGLHVLGFVTIDGDRIGWVPDKKIHYFVFK